MVFLRGKVIVIGDSCVGKTAICQVLGSDGGMYPKNYNSTIMTDLVIKQIQLTDNNDTVELFLHDSSGKAIYFDCCKETWLNADMICLIYDVNNRESFSHLKFWYDNVKQVFSNEKKIIGCVIGNKSDLNKIVTSANGKQLADSIGFKYFECSAKDNQNIIEPFKFLATEYVKNYKDKVNAIKSIVE